MHRLCCARPGIRKMLSDRVKPFKWKPFDLYNDICIERYRKIHSPPIKTTSAATSANRSICCDACNRHHHYRPPTAPDRNDKINPKSFLVGASEPHACDFVDPCESNRKSNWFCVRDKYADAIDAIDGDSNNNGANWPTVSANKYVLSPNVMSPSPFAASAYNGSAGSSCGDSTTSSLSPNSIETNCNTANKVDNKIDTIMFRRSMDSAPPIVYGPLPYSKYRVWMCSGQRSNGP